MASGDTLAIFTPMAYEPPASNYATLGLVNARPVLAFDGTADEEAVWAFVVPANYAGGGFTLDTFWCFASATSGNLRVQADIESIGSSGTLMSSDSFSGTFQSAGGTPGSFAATLRKVTITFTDGAQIDSAAIGQYSRLKIRRDADGTSGSDDITTDALLLFAHLKET